MHTGKLGITEFGAGEEFGEPVAEILRHPALPLRGAFRAAPYAGTVSVS
jgi:hypothetical protein